MTQQTMTEATPAPETSAPETSAPEARAQPQRDEHAGDEALVAEELLVEEVSIDGMCGVYCAGARPGFDLDRPWCLDDRVAVRPSRSARCCITSAPGGCRS